MLNLIEPSNYARLQPLFARASIHLALAAVLDGSVAASVYVDNASHPQSALVIAGHRFFLLGRLDQPGFNQSIQEFFDQMVFPHGLAAGEELFVLYFDDSGWESSIETIFQGKYPLLAPREYYQLNLNGEPPRVDFPPDFSLRSVDKRLLASSNLAHLDHLREELCSERANEEDFLAQSFGISLVHEDELAGWCLSEYNTGSCCEVGIETSEAFQKRGLGTAMTREFARQAYQRGITTIGWHCFTRNLPSAATARKAGFAKICDYHVFLVWYNPHNSPGWKRQMQASGG